MEDSIFTIFTTVIQTYYQITNQPHTHKPAITTQQNTITKHEKSPEKLSQLEANEGKYDQQPNEIPTQSSTTTTTDIPILEENWKRNMNHPHPCNENQDKIPSKNTTRSIIRNVT